MDYIFGNPKAWPAKDTSWQAWFIVVMCSVANASTLTLLYSFGIFVVSFESPPTIVSVAFAAVYHSVCIDTDKSHPVNAQPQ